MQQKTFDLILVDLKMPRMDGLTLIHKVKTQYQDLKILVVSGMSNEKITESIWDGADHFVEQREYLNFTTHQANRTARPHFAHGMCKVDFKVALLFLYCKSPVWILS